jgi:glyceraldehyde-3-phosphate dehydrogenase (NAD(P))
LDQPALEGPEELPEVILRRRYAPRGRPHDNLYEVALWSAMLRVQEDELLYAYMVDNQAIVIPETVDAIRALTGAEQDGRESIVRTNAAIGIDGSLVQDGCLMT